MYHQIGIQKLSKNQILKLLRGHRIRVKHGQHHTIHASKEQYKKIMSAHRKGQGCCIQFDPFQMQMPEHHHHLKQGKGWFTDTLKDFGRELAPHAIDFVADKAKKWVSGSGKKKGNGSLSVLSPIGQKFCRSHDDYNPSGIHLPSGMDLISGFGRKRGRPKRGGFLRAKQPYLNSDVSTSSTPLSIPAPVYVPVNSGPPQQSAFSRALPVLQAAHDVGQVMFKGSKKGSGKNKHHSGGALYPAGYDKKDGNGAHKKSTPKQRGKPKKGKGPIGAVLGSLLGGLAGKSAGGDRGGVAGKAIGGIIGEMLPF